jgi:hypothetical protein
LGDLRFGLEEVSFAGIYVSSVVETIQEHVDLRRFIIFAVELVITLGAAAL